MFEQLLEQIKATEFVDKILETYRRVETDKSYTTQNGSVNTPVATLADEYGGRAQVGIDDGCYVLYLIQEDGTYKRTAWVFPEAHEVLKDLPDPREAQLAKARAVQARESFGRKKEYIDDPTIRNQEVTYHGQVYIYYPTIDRIERGMMIELIKSEGSVLVLDVNKEDELVLVWFYVGGTREHKSWVPLSDVKVIWDIGGYAKAVHMLDQFGAAMKDLLKGYKEVKG